MRYKSCFILLIIVVILTSCNQNTSKSVVSTNIDYSVEAIREEILTTGIIKNINIETSKILIVDTNNENEIELEFHGGVNIYNDYGSLITIDSLQVGDVVDVEYYGDNFKLITITISDRMTVINEVTKLSVDAVDKKATTKGVSYALSNYAMAFSDGELIDIREINLEDQVTVKLLDNKIVAVIIELGHGYVRLKDYNTFIGGTVEIGYDVIVPVTDDMLLTVREGNYKLRITKGEFSEYKNIAVIRDKDVEISLSELQIPYGNLTFEITPVEAKIYVNGKELEGSSYYNLYGTYPIKIIAEGYNSYLGSFKIDEAYEIKSYTLSKIEEEEEEEEEVTSTAASSSEVTTTQVPATVNTVRINTPVGAQVYVDGDYVGEAPVSFTKVAGTHTLTLYKTGCIIKSYTIESKDDGKNDEYSFEELTTLSELVE